MKPTVTLDRSWRFPTPEVRELSNGTQVHIFHMPEQKLAALELMIPTPLCLEPREVEGVSAVALYAADEATTQRDDVQELLELAGAALDGATWPAFTSLALDFPAHRLEQAIPLFAEILQQPRYSEADIQRHVEWQIAAFESRLASPAAVADQAVHTALYGELHREGRPLEGTPETLSAITPDAVHAWHRERWGAAPVMVLAGNVPSETMHVLDASFGAAEITPVSAYQRPTALAAHVVVVDLPDAVQANIRAMLPTVGRESEDWAPARLGAHVVVGAFASRLNLELREQLGYTYGISGGMRPRSTGAEFLLSTATNADVAADAVLRILAAVDVAEPFTSEEIESARMYLVGVGPLANETASDVARQAARLVAANQPADFINQHFRNLDDVTADEATAAFRRHVSADRLTIAISGPAERIAPQLQRHGLPVTVL